MYSETIWKSVAAVLGVDYATFKADMDAEDEKTLEVPKLFTETQKNDFGTNRFNDGKKAMKEILVKDIKEAHPEVEYEGKDLEGFLEKFGEHKVTEAKVVPDTQVKTLKGDKKLLQEKIQGLENQLKEKDTQHKSEINRFKKAEQIRELIPDNTTIGKSDVIILFNNKYESTQDEDGTEMIVDKVTGQPLRDDSLNYLPLKSVLNTFIEDKKLLNNGGMGGDDDDGNADGKFKTLSSFENFCKKKDWMPTSDEAQAYLKDHMAEDFAFDK